MSKMFVRKSSRRPSGRGGLPTPVGAERNDTASRPVAPQDSPSPASSAGVTSPLGDATLVTLFAARVAAQPRHVALSLGSTSLTYAELDSRADRLAHRLAAMGAGPGAIVGLCLPRSLDLIVAMLAILKSGAAYLPLDPAYPGERLAFMVEDANAMLVVAASNCADWLPSGRRRLDPHDQGDAEATDRALPARKAEASDLAYVIYTSGSTGRPKGVAIEHGAVTRLFSATQHWFGFRPTDVWTLFHSVSFDFSVWEIWGALLHGGRLVIVPEATARDPVAFLRLLADDGVTVLNQTPSAFAALDRADHDVSGRDRLALRLVIFGGEALDPRRLAGWYRRRGEHAHLVNMYGITETTVHVTYRPMSPADTELRASPIGHPIPDLDILLLDGETMQPVPAGEVGEIFVAGAGLARGYLNRPDLTASRFVPHPHKPGERLYRSGDLARLNEDGEYEHLGRADQQVKIRGFRVELGEIEAALLSHPAIGQAAALLRSDDGHDRLVGYLVANGGERPSPSALKAHLAQALPDHMVPGTFVFVPHLPLTVNGKLDRAALPPPNRSRPDSVAPYCAPRNALERRLAEVVADVLQIDHLGIDDNFFDLGGNSLLLVEIHRRLVRDLAGLGLIDLYRRPNLRALGGHLTPAASGVLGSLAAARERGMRSRGVPPSSQATPVGSRDE
ncbi:amino acid adenylation domain-containing protein [Bosea sp. NBC_00550]|uniref:amino acid adenylation domain-containing protein n=1 Tax=Bosea sp. NBC_00550 TaxID=2969621 RepID=UPI002230701D|nr:amino acid adenylation domain-containing protein [Bosea sp. NBC_00550]UZF91586.1 amino acid adenylation domain-containing protein [Bosea sp. NBC_00550]